MPVTVEDVVGRSAFTTYGNAGFFVYFYTYITLAFDGAGHVVGEKFVIQSAGRELFTKVCDSI